MEKKKKAAKAPVKKNEIKIETPVPEVEEDTVAVPAEELPPEGEAEAPARAEVVRVARFRGQRIVNEGKRTVGETVLHTITIASGNVMDLTDEEYEKEVTFEYYAG